MSSLEGRAALVTGANRGIGLEIARQLGRRGARVALGARDLARGEEAAAGLRAAGVDAAAVALDVTDAASIFQAVRQIPEIVDGIRCQCGCADLPGFYSLLSCYESAGMARICVICQGEARLALRLHQGGKTLDQIRAAIDARYG